ncbi:MAG TPA: pirin family protein [Streptosporangiaceae bacterium]|nr:pirin family protein [Streptosporangiaceae bacterium]
MFEANPEANPAANPEANPEADLAAKPEADLAADLGAKPEADLAARPEWNGAIERTVARVAERRMLGPDAQVDDKALVIAPDNLASTDPFIALSEDWFSEPGFQWHPHRGLETVTTVVGGVLEHGDNIGNAGALHQGDVQWMTAGRGIIHRELAFRNERVHTLQLWLNLPARSKLVETGYQDLTAAARPRVTSPGLVIDVISGTIGGVTGPAVNQWPVQACIVSLEPGTAASYELPASHRAFAYVLAGEVTVAGRRVRAGQTAWSHPAAGSSQVPTSSLRLAAPAGAQPADRPARVMIYSGEPIGEAVTLGGPFVMNTRAEIEQAFADFHAGRFGPVPRQARLKYDR